MQTIPDIYQTVDSLQDCFPIGSDEAKKAKHLKDALQDYIPKDFHPHNSIKLEDPSFEDVIRDVQIASERLAQQEAEQLRLYGTTSAIASANAKNEEEQEILTSNNLAQKTSVLNAIQNMKTGNYLSVQKSQEEYVY